jgi:pilus assembly protein TadC
MKYWNWWAYMLIALALIVLIRVHSMPWYGYACGGFLIMIYGMNTGIELVKQREKMKRKDALRRA